VTEGVVPAPAVFAEGQVITVFRSRRRPGSEAAYLQLSEEMRAAARAVPGFVDFKTFAASDGEQVSLITFASLESHRFWRDDPRHRRAQRRGRGDFYLGYSVQVGSCTHVSRWTRDPGLPD
jgi:heme-degrading monooxygenase HmoA